MIAAAALFGWSLFVAILLLAMLSGLFEPRPILFIAIFGSAVSALASLTLIFT